MKGRILHYVCSGFPTQPGYTLCTQAIASNLRRVGYDALVCVQLDCAVERGANGQPYLYADGIPNFGLPSQLCNNRIRRFLGGLARRRIHAAQRACRIYDLAVEKKWLKESLDRPN